MALKIGNYDVECHENGLEVSDKLDDAPIQTLKENHLSTSSFVSMVNVLGIYKKCSPIHLC